MMTLMMVITIIISGDYGDDSDDHSPRKSSVIKFFSVWFRLRINLVICAIHALRYEWKTFLFSFLNATPSNHWKILERVREIAKRETAYVECVLGLMWISSLSHGFTSKVSLRWLKYSYLKLRSCPYAELKAIPGVSLLTWFRPQLRFRGPNLADYVQSAHLGTIHVITKQ